MAHILLWGLGIAGFVGINLAAWAIVHGGKRADRWERKARAEWEEYLREMESAGEVRPIH